MGVEQHRVDRGAPACAPLADVLRRRALDEPDAIVLRSARGTWTAAGLLDAATARPPSPDGIVVVDDVDPAAAAVETLTAAITAVAVPVPHGLPAAARAELLARVRALDLAPDGGVEPVDRVAVVFSTSGSSGRPKIVPTTHRNLWASAGAAVLGQRLGPGDRCLALGAMSHTLGLRVVTDAVWCGASAVVPDGVHVDAVLEVLLAHRPTCVVAPPPALPVLALALDQAGEEVTRAIRFVRTGSARVPDEARARLARSCAAPLLSGYGMTEAAKIACTPLDGGAPAGSVGRPLGVELRIDDDQQIVVRGDGVTPGAAGPDGWFATGDLGRLDDDGNLFLLGRRDDLVSRGGELVSLTELERAAAGLPGVVEALAVAVDHPSLGSDIVLAYVRDPDEPVRSTAAVRDGLRAVVDRAHVPTRIVSVPSLPRTTSGKPSRPLLAEALGAADASGDAVPQAHPELAALWRDVLGVQRVIRAEEDFFALGGDSLRLVELCTAISERCAADVLPGDLIANPTLAEMAVLVWTRPSGRAHPLVSLRAGGPDRVRLYFVPGAGGTVAELQPVVARLAPGRTVLGFEAPGLYGGERALRSVGEYGRRYAEVLLDDAGDRPFVVAGISFGALVAQEMTRRLERLGRPPVAQVLVDAVVRPRDVSRSRIARRRVARVLHKLRNGTDRSVDPLALRIRWATIRAREMGMWHRPRPTVTRTVLLTSEQHRAASGDDRLGWGPILGDSLEVVALPGTHLGLVHEGADLVAPVLEEVLGRLDGSLLETRAASCSTDAEHATG